MVFIHSCMLPYPYILSYPVILPGFNNKFVQKYVINIWFNWYEWFMYKKVEISCIHYVYNIN